MARKRKRRNTIWRFKAHEKVVLTNSNNDEINSTCPLVVSFSAASRTLDARSPQPAILSDSNGNSLGINGNPLITKVF